MERHARILGCIDTHPPFFSPVASSLPLVSSSSDAALVMAAVVMLLAPYRPKSACVGKAELIPDKATEPLSADFAGGTGAAIGYSRFASALLITLWHVLSNPCPNPA
jgi:hypothetical protein